MKKLIYLLMSLSFVAFVSCEDDKGAVKHESGIESNHEYVDFGLPSGTLWATCNVGASAPQDYGDYYAFGEVTTKETYDWSTYLDGNMSSSSDCGTDKDLLKGMFDIAGTQYDAAKANWGGKWQTPTIEQLIELTVECHLEWIDNYNDTNVSGYIVYRAKNSDDKGFNMMPSETYSLADTHIFLPTTGLRLGDKLIGTGAEGGFWLSSLETQGQSYSFVYTPHDGFRSAASTLRDIGFPIRAVISGKRSALTVYKSGSEKGHDYVDLGLPSGTKWATCNVGARIPYGYGEYYAWGETRYYSGGVNTEWNYYLDRNITSSSDCGTDKDLLKGLTDIAGTQYDAAYVNWGGKWRMPTKDQWDELLNECYWVYTTSYNNSHINGGYIVYKAKTSSDKGVVMYYGNGIAKSSYSISDAHIFLPEAYFRGGLVAGDGASYWSSSQNTDSPSCAYAIGFGSSGVNVGSGMPRYDGCSVRAVIPGK